VRVRARLLAAEISAIVLQKMRETAEGLARGEVSEAVVTVPAYFDDAQRQATRTPAGSPAQRAADRQRTDRRALAYGIETEGAQRVAVYDLAAARSTSDPQLSEALPGPRDRR